MSQVDELLNQLTASPVKTAGAGLAEEHIVISRDRYITVPDSLKKIGVQYDHNIETVTFDCPRYWDDIDMSEMKIYVNYMRADEHMGMYLCENVVVEDDIIHFDWTISKDVTNVDGYISFLVCIKKTDEEGNEENHWNSEINNDLYISKGLNCQGSVIHKHPDIITQLLTRMENVEVEQQDWESTMEQGLEQWKTQTSNNLDKRMKVAEGNTTPEEILNRIHEALNTNETTQEIIKSITDNYIPDNKVVADIIDKVDAMEETISNLTNGNEVEY